jgi:hypothetical protein
MTTTETTSAWTKLPPIEAHYGGCLNCGPRPAQFPPDGVIAVGFGYAALHKDGAPVWSEDEAVSDNSMMTGADAEALAAQDPDHDWRIVLHGPLSGRTYQRHGLGKWMLVEKNDGFA